MGRMVYAPLAEATVTTDTDQDVLELTAGSANKVRLHYIELTSDQVTAESVELRLLRRTTAGSGGSLVTGVLADEDDGAITAVIDRLHTTPGSAGAVLGGWRWEQLGPWRFAPTPRMMPLLQESGIMGLNVNSALGGSRIWNGLIVWEEI